MSDHYVVAIGASAGGVQALQELLSVLPKHLDAPIVIALHSNEHSMLTKVLSNSSPVPVKMAEHNEVLDKGMIYVAPGATHVFFQNNRLILSDLVSNSGFRPSIDALFMTMAAEYKEKSIAVVLSGTLKDGMRGAQVIYDMGGQTIVQDPSDALETDMPKSIIYGDHPQAILSATKLGIWLKDLIGKEE